MTINANTRIHDNAVQRAVLLRQYEKGLQGKVAVIIDGHVVRVDKLIRDAELSKSGFQRLQRVLGDEISETYIEAFKTSKRGLLDLVGSQVSYMYQNIETTMGRIWNAQRPQRRIAEELVLDTPLYKDQRLAPGWIGVSLGERMRLEKVIREGIAEGLTPAQIALNVRKGNALKISRNQADALVTTAVTAVSAKADHAVYEANSKAITGWQYVAVLDSRTTPECFRRDGKIYRVGETKYLPPAHYRCRSTTVPVFKSWKDIADLEGVAAVRRRNIGALTPEQIAFYDGNTPLKESYNDWLLRQPQEIQLRHLGDYQQVDLFNSGALTVDKFVDTSGNLLGIGELRKLTDAAFTLPGDTKRFANAKAKLDAMQLGAASPDDFLSDSKLKKTLVDYYLLQAGELDGTLSLTNYRGALLHTKKSTKRNVLTSPPREEQLKFNPLTGRYEDVRLYQPNPAVLANSLRLADASDDLKDADKVFIREVSDSLSDKMSVNERAVVADNLRVTFGRYRKSGEVWGNFKAVSQAQMKFDVMNVSDTIETQIRKDRDVLKKLTQDNYLDPVLGPTFLEDIEKGFIDNIVAKNSWEDYTAPKIAKELRGVFNTLTRDPRLAAKHPLLWKRIGERELQQFYLKFAHRLSLADSPDRDAFAVALGRDLFTLANLNGSKKAWYELGMEFLDSPNAAKLYKVETFGVQKRRMKSRLSGSYFGPYYDTLAYNIRIVDPRIQEYAQLTRKVELGLRVPVRSERNRLYFRKGYKTYFMKGRLGWVDSRIPVTSTSSFSDFPADFMDDNMVDALNWASEAQYKIDGDFHDFITKLLYFEDDRGNAKRYNDLNEYRKYIAARGDAYERFKSMEWLRKTDSTFSNHAFVDHRARVYDRGLISPQSGETFRPFLNTAEAKLFSPEEFDDFQDQIGAFLGGLSDKLEGDFNSLTITGRQKIAKKWRDDMVLLGNHMLRGKPADIRAVLEHPLVHAVEGEEQTKFFRFAMEMAKIDRHLGGDYSRRNLEKLREYRIALALEQDASSSGAQIIALTTRNKQLAELSNVVPTNQKRRLYDEIAAATFSDPRFKKLNEKLGLTEKDLRKAAKAQNMVECCHV